MLFLIFSLYPSFFFLVTSYKIRKKKEVKFGLYTYFFPLPFYCLGVLSCCDYPFMLCLVNKASSWFFLNSKCYSVERWCKSWVNKVVPLEFGMNFFRKKSLWLFFAKIKAAFLLGINLEPLFLVTVNPCKMSFLRTQKLQIAYWWTLIFALGAY